MITDFRQKKVAEYLQPGQRVLIRFGHGLGDCIMFIPLLDSLRMQFPDTQIDLYVESGQEQIWESVPDKDAAGYDHVFSLDFPMAEGSTQTKAEKCATDELGIAPFSSFVALAEQPSPFVACHFQGTALPGSVNWPEEKAAEVWEEIIAFGKIPFEVHFEHLFHNPVNARMWFLKQNPSGGTARGCQANLPNLIGLIQRCWAFIGVCSGPMCVALSVMPEQVLVLENRHHIASYTHLSVPALQLETYRKGQVTEWLSTLT